MLTASIFKKLSLGLVLASLLAGLFLSAAPTGTASAAAPAATQAPAQDDSQGKAIARLETRYQNELKTLDRQGQWVERTQKIVSWVNQVIDKLLGKGKNVQPLKDALAKFSAGVETAKASHDRAAAILNTHAGFDASGKVIDRKAAQETVRTAGQDLQDASLQYRLSALQLRIAVRDYIRSLRTR